MSLYRRLMTSLGDAGATHVYSHQLAKLAGVTAAQVRRDMMAIGYSGSPTRGYEVQECLASIASFLDGPGGREFVLVGLGKLGRAVLSYFALHQPSLAIVAAFDSDPAKVGVTDEGCPCYSVDDLERVIPELGVAIAIITVPAAAAQGVADRLVSAGVTSIINFAPVALHLPEHVFVEDMDIAAAMESAAFFAGRTAARSAEREADSDLEMEPMVKKLESLLAGAETDLTDLAGRIGAKVLSPGRPGARISRIYAGDRVSDLLNQASDKTLLVSNVASLQMVRIAELMDVPGICFVNGVTPGSDAVAMAKTCQTLLMVSPIGVFETCGLIYASLADQPTSGAGARSRRGLRAKPAGSGGLQATDTTAGRPRA